MRRPLPPAAPGATPRRDALPEAEAPIVHRDPRPTPQEVPLSQKLAIESRLLIDNEPKRLPLPMSVGLVALAALMITWVMVGGA